MTNAFKIFFHTKFQIINFRAYQKEWTMKLAQSERLDDEMSLLPNCFSMNGEEGEDKEDG